MAKIAEFGNARLSTARWYKIMTISTNDDDDNIVMTIFDTDHGLILSWMDLFSTL